MKVKFTVLLFVILLLPGNLFPQATIQNILNNTKIDSLMKFVRELSGAVPVNIGGTTYTISSRHKNQPGNDLAASYVKQKFTQYGLQAFDQHFGTVGRNVYAVKTGTDYPNKKYMICAHYDAMPSTGLAPGADDNASGTAAVIEAARVFSQYSFPYTLIFAIWDEEEQGLYGSKYYAQQAQAAGDSIMGVINLDMIAWENNNDDKVRVHTKNLATSYKLSTKMVELNTAYGIGLVTSLKDPGITASDHSSFWDCGYGAILLIEDDAGDFNSYYHTSNDLIQYFDIPYFEKCSKLSLATLAAFALHLDLFISHNPQPAISTLSDIVLNAGISTRLQVGTGSKTPRIYYRIKTGSTYSPFSSSQGVSQGNGLFSFTIPAQPSGTLVQYYFAAQDEASQIIKTLPEGGGGFDPPGSTAPSNLFQFYVANVQLAFADSAKNAGNWTASGSWAVTSQKCTSSPYSFTDSPGGVYGMNQTLTFTTTNPVTIPVAFGASLRFKTQWEIESNYDYGQVQVSTDNGTTWTALPGMYTEPGQGSYQPNGQPVYDGAKASWVDEDINLSAYTGKQIKIRFLLKTDGAIAKDGWYIDDINLVTYTPVPVELTGFTASVKNNSVKLSWQTATELNNRGYQIQRSTDNVTWQDVVFIRGNGTTSDPHSYSYTHSGSERGYFYYRLKQMDYSGAYTIYGPVTADLSTPDNFVLGQNYPNPFNPATSIKYALPSECRVVIAVYNSLGEMTGKLVDDIKPAGFHEVQFNAAGLTSGIYFYTLDAVTEGGKEGYHEVKKMVILK